jgi:multidrug resistance efflux pump
MTWANRFRLFFGLLAVLVIVGACTIAFNQRQLRADSTTASFVAEQISVGSVYAGTIVEQLVEQGDDVAAGEILFRVRSPMLARDLAAETVTADDLGVAVSADGTFDVVATVDGTVSEVHSPVGDFAQTGEVLADLDRAETLTVVAEFSLSPRDYGRIGIGTTVEMTMPDDRTIRGLTTDIDVDTLDGQAIASITIESAALRAQTIDGLYRPGTPLRASLLLRDDGPLAGVSDVVRDFFWRIGL